MCVCVYTYVCTYVHVCRCMCVCVYIRVRMYLCMYFFMNIIIYVFARMGGMRGAYRVFVGESDLKRPPRRPGRRWEKILKLILKKWNWETLNGLSGSG